jgi:hypothetical protein
MKLLPGTRSTYIPEKTFIAPLRPLPSGPPITTTESLAWIRLDMEIRLYAERNQIDFIPRLRNC